jgi:hypothetical protein
MVLEPTTAFAAAAALGTMTVASWVNVRIVGARGGYELPLTYGGIAVGLGFTGAGAWSLDHQLTIDYTQPVAWGAAAVVSGLIPAACVIRYSAHNRPHTETFPSHRGAVPDATRTSHINPHRTGRHDLDLQRSRRNHGD